MLLPKKQVKAD